MIELLEISSACKSPALAMTLSIVKNILNIIRIVGPILLIISLIITLINLITNPDDKKLQPKIKNSIIAILVLFFIPTIINMVMGMLGESTSFSACWESASDIESNSNYVDPYETDKKGLNSENYEKGDPSQATDNTQLEGTATKIGDVVWDPKDVTKISNLTSSQLIQILKTTKKYRKAVNFIPYASALITAEQKYHVNVFFLLGIQALESGWATSKISKNCNNLGGVRESKAHPSNGCGRNKGGGFAYFNTVNDFIDYQASLLHNHYLTKGGKYYNGTTPEGVSIKYCGGSKSWSKNVRLIAGNFFKQAANIM